MRNLYCMLCLREMHAEYKFVMISSLSAIILGVTLSQKDAQAG